MRFIGNKEKLLENIYQVIQSKEIQGVSFFDFFSGTVNVGKFFKQKNYKVYSSDLLYFSYVLQRAYIVNNQEPKFENLINTISMDSILLLSSPLIQAVEFLNQIKPIEGFIFHNYTPEGTANLKNPRMFFTGENGKIIDAIRSQIESWKKSNFISENEYFILLACLIETVPFYANITGVYAAFQKKWDPRAKKQLKLRAINLITNQKENISFNQNSVDLLKVVKSDILYLDPPYNRRQYAPNYHLLETIAKYDNPEIKGIAGLRNYENQKSLFCNPKLAIVELEKIIKISDSKTIILSYNSEGIMKKDEILSILKKYGMVELVEIKYNRYKSNSKGQNQNKKYITEQLYILKKNEK